MRGADILDGFLGGKCPGAMSYARVRTAHTGRRHIDEFAKSLLTPAAVFDVRSRLPVGPWISRG